MLASLFAHLSWTAETTRLALQQMPETAPERVRAVAIYAHLAAAEHIWLARLEARRPAHRALLTNPAPPMSVRRTTRHAMPPEPATVAPQRARFGGSVKPRFVPMGHPPRDPRGEFRDVYRNLMHPLFPARRPWSDSEHVLWLGLTGAACVATLGVAPALYGWQLRKRRKKYGDLFRHGVVATGTILSIPGTDDMHTMVKYELEAGGMPYRGDMQLPGEMMRYWSVSDAVAILHDPEDPSQSCIVYR